MAHTLDFDVSPSSTTVLAIVIFYPDIDRIDNWLGHDEGIAMGIDPVLLT